MGSELCSKDMKLKPNLHFQSSDHRESPDQARRVHGEPSESRRSSRAGSLRRSHRTGAGSESGTVESSSLLSGSRSLIRSSEKKQGGEGNVRLRSGAAEHPCA
ncbi:hypothetical protein CRG98_043989 [Punica granatum]|uniref:Uncharacterized protein n=1 Tax=Punica granatum TaxID=22663 RepID=A0A2I0HV11_PUNGR|nr:hypothetical protein CRG98_043989 [Punica granatum]